MLTYRWQNGGLPEKKKTQALKFIQSPEDLRKWLEAATTRRRSGEHCCLTARALCGWGGFILWGFSPGYPASSHTPKTWIRGGLGILNCQWECMRMQKVAFFHVTLALFYDNWERLQQTPETLISGRSGSGKWMNDRKLYDKKYWSWGYLFYTTAGPVRLVGRWVHLRGRSWVLTHFLTPDTFSRKDSGHEV